MWRLSASSASPASGISSDGKPILDKAQRRLGRWGGGEVGREHGQCVESLRVFYAGGKPRPSSGGAWRVQACCGTSYA